jgi:hypothetical protein
MKCLQQKTTANEEHYKQKRKKQIKYINKQRNYDLTTKQCKQMKLIREIKQKKNF